MLPKLKSQKWEMYELFDWLVLIFFQRMISIKA